MTTGQTSTITDNIDLAKKCLSLISIIAARGARSQDPEQIGYALQELTQVLFERTGSDERRFEPIPAGQIRNLKSLHAGKRLVNRIPFGREL